jgi:hypothetical protein
MMAPRRAALLAGGFVALGSPQRQDEKGHSLVRPRTTFPRPDRGIFEPLCAVSVKDGPQVHRAAACP